MKNGKKESVLETEKERRIYLLREIVKRYSPTGSEANVAKFIMSFLREQGVKSYIDEVGNVIAGEGDLLLCSHIDTVPGELPVRIEGDFIYGRGVVDAKASVASFIMSIVESDSPCSLALVVEEEGSSRGANHLLENFTWKNVLIGEPSKINTIVVGYKGRILLEIISKGTATHVAIPSPDNAVMKAFKIFKEMEAMLPKGESFFDSSIANITHIQGGETFNVIPESCEMMVDIRVGPKQMETVLQAIDDIKKQEGENVDIRVAESTTAVYQPDSRVKKALEKSIKNHRLQPRIVRKLGTCDMNLIGERAEIASYGPGDPKLSHTNQEKLALTEYNLAIDILLDFIKGF
jgi:LysW-gamma-L-lysine carboxypeptidase